MCIQDQLLGQGLTSIVRGTEYEGQMCAKKIFKENISLKSRQKEIQMLLKVNHKNLVKMMAHDSGMNWLITELLNKHDLFDYLAGSGKPFSQRSIQFVIGQLLDAVEYLHSQEIVHRDIKLENILFDNEFTLKLCDLGFAESMSIGKVARQVGTEGYLAPELQIAGYTDANELKTADAFSLGVCLFTLAFAHPPFKTSKKTCAYWRTIQAGKWQQYWNAVDKKNIADEEFRSIIQGLLEADPQKRMQISELRHWCSNGSKAEFIHEMQQRGQHLV